MTRLFDADTWMWDEALSALELAERHQRRFFTLIGVHTYAASWEPPVDMFETDGDIWIMIALPGVSADQVVLRVHATELVVQTVRVPRAGIEAMRIRRLEIPYGAFERRIELPAGRYTLREQRMVDGCLDLHLVRE
jgi:HSP20 family protein